MKEFIKLPHSVWDYQLNSGELQVYTAIASFSNRFACCIVRHSVLADLCGISVATVTRAVQRLQCKGLLTVTKRHDRKGQLIANKYILTTLQGGFTCVPRNIWGYKLAKSDFKVYLFLLRCQSYKRCEALPSLSQMVSALHMSKRTIVDAINKLSTGLLLCKTQYIRKQDNRLGHNRYILLTAIVRLLLALMLARLATGCKKERRVTLSQRITRQHPPVCIKLNYKIAHVVEKVKDFLCSRAFLLRGTPLFVHRFVGTTLIRQ